jgi:signal transduction histidine kinase
MMMSVDKIKRLERLLEVSRGLSVAGDVEKYLQSVLSAATELTESETASIMEFDDAAKELRFTVVPWFHRETLMGVKVPLDGSAAGSVYLQGQPVIIRDANTDIRHFHIIDRLSQFKTRSLLGVPMLLHGTPFGVFEVLNKTNSAYYTEEDVTILETLASLASAALHNDRMERKLRDPSGDHSELDRLKNEFIAITSHELRTPLGLILGHATFLREMLGKEYHEQLDAIIRNASRLKEIIENISSVDNYQSGMARLRQRKVSIVRIIEDVAASFQEMADQKGVRLRLDLGSQDVLVDADGSKIAIALSNLVKNAITFTDSGGQILIKTELSPGYVKVSVIDNGVGIPARDLPRVFERFFQVESHLTRRHGGMGLGLSVAKVMIEMHGGRIWVESVEGKGSNFTFLLPIETQTAPQAEGPFHT